MRIVTFASGSSGNCTLVSENGCHILIDAGISMRRIKQNLAAFSLTVSDISAILITHEHSDHISGCAMLSKYFDTPILAPKTVASRLHYSIAGIDRVLSIIPVGEKFSCGAFSVTAFPTPHDADESVGYRLEGDSVFALATDMGCVTPEIREGLFGADAVVIESNHDVDMLSSGPYTYALKRRILSRNGHLSNDDCAILAGELAEKGTKYIILGHLSRENNTPDKAFSTVAAALRGSGAQLFTAPADKPLCIEFARESLNAEC